MEFSVFIESIGVGVVILAHLVVIVSKFQKHENKLNSIEKRLDDLQDGHLKLVENSKTLHNIEGKIEIMINLYQKNIK